MRGVKLAARPTTTGAPLTAMPKRRRQASSTDDSDSDDSDEEVQQDGRVVYFYADVSRESVLRLVRALRRASEHAIRHSVACSEAAFVQLFIHSDGGDVYAGLSGMDHIRNCPVPVHTIADGFVASAATLLLLAGRRRYCQPHASLLIHQLSSHFAGKYCELKDEMQNSKSIMKMFKQIYKSTTKLTDEQLQDLLSKELTVTATRSLKLGFVDAIYGDDRA